MPQSVVHLDVDLASKPLAGRTLQGHWQAVVAEAGLRPGDGPGPCIAIDGRYPGVTARRLRDLATSLASGTPAALVTPDGAVVATARAEALPGIEGLAHPGGRTLHLDPAEAVDVSDEWGRAAAEIRVVAGVRRRLAAVGVRLVDPDRVWIEPTVRVAAGATLWGGCVLRGQTRIAAGAVIHPGVILDDTEVGTNSIVKAHSVCTQARIGADCSVGPMAHLRPGAVLGIDVKVGNFVEVKKATLHDGVRASHLSYLGDAEVGAGANVGAGTITCNYDGHGKHRTEIGAAAFIGSNTALVAPIRIGNGAIVGAGSTVTRSIPDDALAVERAEERVFEGRAPTLHARNRRRAGKDG